MKLFNFLFIGVFLLFVTTRCFSVETESAEAFDETVAAQPESDSEPEPVAPSHTESTTTASSEEKHDCIFAEGGKKAFAIIGDKISWLKSLPSSINHDKLHELVDVMKEQHPITILTILALPFIIYSVTLRFHGSENLEHVVQNSKFTPRLSEEEYKKQTKEFTEAELAKLQNYIKQNPSVIDSTEYYKKTITTEAS